MDFIRYAQDKGAEHVELKSLSTSRNSIETVNNEIKEFSAGTSKSFGVRLFHNGRIGSAFSNKEDYKELIDNALQCAKLCNEKFSIDENKAWKKRFKTPVKKNPDDLSLSEKKERITKIRPEKYIESLGITYTDIKRKFILETSEGSDLQWDDTITLAVCSALSRKNDRIESFYNILAEHQGYEVMESFEDFCCEVMNTSIDMLDSKAAKAGQFPIAVDQRLGGVFAHEAIGHACEADLIINNNSILKDRIGEPLGNEILNINDQGSLKGKWGWTPFDNEGTLSGKTELIKKGILSGYLHNRITAKKMDSAPTGNGRSQNLSNRIIPRMTNTYIENGDSNFDEIIESVNNGYYLKRSAGGQVDPSTGEFLFNALECFEVINGEIKGRIRGASMTGNILTTLKEISLIGNDLLIEGGGACGKAGQYVLTGEGSPHMKIDNVKIGGSH